MRMPLPAVLTDERFLMHRLRATSRRRFHGTVFPCEAKGREAELRVI